MSDFAIGAESLTRYFGRKCAVDSVNLSVPRGCITALIGRNGSGKTTLIRMLLGMLEPTRGSASLLGHSSVDIPPSVRARIGYVAEGHPLYGWMTVGQLARYQAAFYTSWNERVYRSIIDHFELDEGIKAGSLSRGQRAGVALALALAPEPELLILDDPSLGLDPVARRAILQVIVDVCGRGDRTIFISTHEMQDVERLADRVLILDRSVLVADAEKEYLLSCVQEYGLPATATFTSPNVLASRIEGDTRRLIVGNADDATRARIRELGGTGEARVTFEDAVIAYLGRRGGSLEGNGGKQ